MMYTRNKCKFCIIFISENYAKKVWTRHELKAAQAKAFTENEEYILPVKFDETELPGINPQIGYLDFKKFTPAQIANLAAEKLRK
ncbi:MAG: TIR domain-containing protein [Ginsengibacter sp.]